MTRKLIHRSLSQSERHHLYFYSFRKARISELISAYRLSEARIIIEKS